MHENIHTPKQTEKRHTDRRGAYIGFAIGFVATGLSMYVPPFFANGDILPLLLLSPLVYAIIGITIATLSSRKRLGWGIFIGTVAGFIVVIVLLLYFLGNSKN
ncbi:MULTISPECIES: hypothetical protein [Micrococcaceae]|uniref:Uncharacterized protein n=2 Tax=Pseudoglutamicibacter albus TaxID=98671 RepID=A0A095YD08_9MICC|nr:MULTISPECIES: hypothetical protein [Micrococcaceae]KGF19996.1 hypothetical protein HMPREF2128_06765 [Pseudoglutamicibacter albus DNF00011]MCG7303922.1 hypothetical protein [Pseudoglutamicibacter albus]MDR7292929.1 hypothetical protein [Pseudoglutamicibacter albus]OFT23900.1 hypothetical protein HMPREF3175_02890 [Arthrobacter sp. HMSC08H08]OFT41029.1 hypothetical protein HMPREF3160_08665 [Arthrobacter sp. HMSC06H05]